MRRELESAIMRRLSENREVNRSLSKNGVKHAKRIRTHMTRREQEAIWRLASKVRNGCIAVEIGSYLGGSACFIASALPVDAQLVCVDTWMNETMDDGDRDTFAEFQANTRNLKSKIRQLRMPSSNLGSQLRESAIDFVFIDGDHSFEAARSDLRWAIENVSDNATIALHDSACFPGVSRAIGEVIAGDKWCIRGHIDNLLWIGRLT